MAIIDIKVPDIGDFKDVAVIELLVKPGDTIKARADADHARERQGDSMEIPSSHAGVVKELKVALGDKVARGSLILTLEVAASTIRGKAAPATPPVRCTPGPSTNSSRDGRRPAWHQLHRHRRPRMRHARARRRSRAVTRPPSAPPTSA